MVGLLSRLSHTISERAGIAGYQTIFRDQLAYCVLATDRHLRLYDAVRQQRVLLKGSRAGRRNSAFSVALHQVPQSVAGSWTWVQICGL